MASCLLSPLLFNLYDGNGGGIGKSSARGRLEDSWCGALMYADDIVLVADSGMELQTILKVIQV